MTKRKTGLWPAYRPLLVLGLVSVAGLVGALIGDGGYDALSWATLGVLVVISAWKSTASQH